MKETSEIEPIVMKYREYSKASQSIAESKQILEEESDEDLRELAKMELSESEALLEEYENELKILLVPKDPNDEKNVIIEVRGGAGGDEAALFAGDLFRMYSRYAERRGWKTSLMSSNETGVGGYKEVSFMIKGKGAYSRLKYESGVHRVQRIPTTESGGRIHTSTATVAVLPEVEDVEIDINPEDVRVCRVLGDHCFCRGSRLVASGNFCDSGLRCSRYFRNCIDYSGLGFCRDRSFIFPFPG